MPEASVMEQAADFPDPPKDTCALCGAAVFRKDGTRTKQHVPPDLLFPAEEKRGRVQLITVAACRACNKQLSDDEERFRDDVTTLLGPAKNADKRSEVYERFQRGLTGKKEDHLLDRLLPHEAGVELLIPRKETDRVLVAIARGLSFKFFGRVIPNDFESSAHSIPAAFGNPGDDGFDLIRSAQVFGARGDTFSFAGLRVDDQSEVWWMVFYSRVPALVIFTPQDEG